MTKFKALGLNKALLDAVSDLGFETPSEVQEKTIPILLQEETDLVALAQTGTGKTAAFGFPLIQKIESESRTTQGLILSPTRELCLQITNEMKQYAKYVKGLNIVAIYGGASIVDQAKQIKKGAQIIVATPGRMKDMIGRGMINISKIDYCILDEADEMLNMGFFEDIKDILSNTPKEKSTWLFSATMPKEVSIIAKKFMNHPQEVTVGAKNSGVDTVQHEYYVVGGRDRYEALKRMADANPGIFSVVFCRTKRDTQRVAEKLNSFRKKQIQMLVATDVAARGIDVDDITHVINYQLPDEIETYTHRSGRTGRAGKSGISMVIITRSEQRKIKTIENIIKQKFISKKIPTGIEICEIQLYHLANKIKNTEINEAVNNYLPAIHDVLEGLDREELIKKIISVEFTRFFAYYSRVKDLNSSEGSDRRDSGRSSRGERSDSNGSVRYFINVGEKDGYDWMSLKDFLRETVNVGRDDLYRVDVKDSFSFFNTDAEHRDTILNTFQDFKVDGRFVNVEVSKSPEGGGGGRRRSNDGAKGRRRSNDGGKERGKDRSYSKGGSQRTGKRRSKKRDGFF